MNLGNPAIAAIELLKDHPDWRAFVDALGAAATKSMNDSLTSPVDTRVHQTSYAAAIRDVWIAIESATSSVSHASVRRPGVRVPDAKAVKPEAVNV